jgi:hypothetical protein
MYVQPRGKDCRDRLCAIFELPVARLNSGGLYGEKMLILFIILSLIYFMCAYKVDYWITLKILGIESECPQFFLTNESVYSNTCIALFLGSVIVLLGVQEISILVGGILLIILWLLSGKFGHNSAFKEYRKSMIEISELQTDTKTRERILEEAKLTNSQLNDKIIATFKSS